MNNEEFNNQNVLLNKADIIEISDSQDIVDNNLEENSHSNVKIVDKKPKNKKIIVFLILGLLIILIAVILVLFLSKKKTDDKITLTNEELTRVNENYYTVDRKINKINAKINTSDQIDNTDVKIYIGSLTLFEKKYSGLKDIEINIDSLSLGINYIEFDINYKNGVKENKIIYLSNDSEDNTISLDKNDNDNDGLLNYQEEIFSTDKDKEDSDSDGLNDYYELFISLTNPLKEITYEELGNDYKIDADNDGLTNKEEYEYNTDPNLEDSDSDGLNDYEELFNYKTNPNLYDTDNDGMSDKDEITYNSDPLVKNSTFNISKNSTDKLLTVEINNASINEYNSLNVTQSNNIILNNNPGCIAGPYSINMDGEVKSATLSYKLTSNVNASFYYINKEKNTLEEVLTLKDGDTISASVEHFSDYVVMNKDYLNSIIKNAPSVSDIKDTNTSSSSKEYIVLGFPIVMALFDYPLYIFELNGKEENMIKNQEKINKVIEADEDLKGIRVEFRKINRISIKVLNALLGWLENTMAESYKSSVGSDDYESVFQYVVFYKRIVGSDELLKYLFGTDKNIILDVEINKEEDSNNDGISDQYIKLICDGKITTQYGTNPFGDVSYEEIQKNKDYDKDGLLNNEEIEIIEENGKVYIVEKSSPIKKDSDDDGIDDKRDLSPLEAIDSSFMVGDDFYKKIRLTSLEKEVENFNSLFNTGKYVMKVGKKYVDCSIVFSNNLCTHIEYTENGQTKYSPIHNNDFAKDIVGEVFTGAMNAAALFGDIISAPDARLAITKYYDLDTSPYTEKLLQNTSYNDKSQINKHSIYGSPDVQYRLNENINRIIKMVESTVKNGNKEVFESKKYLPNASGPVNDIEPNLNVFGLLYVSSAYVVMEAENNNEEYNMKLRYVISDVYDWNNAENCGKHFLACATEISHFNEMLLGKGKAFLIQIEYDIDVKWKKGNTYTSILLTNTPYNK